MVSLAAPHAKGKKSNDVIFGASAAAKADIRKIGAEHVVNATIGTILDDDEKIVCLPVVERVFKSLPMADIISYAPIAGTPKYLEDAQAVCFGSHRPDAYTAAISTTGGTGGIHHAVHNYTSPGTGAHTRQSAKTITGSCALTSFLTRIPSSTGLPLKEISCTWLKIRKMSWPSSIRRHTIRPAMR